MEISDKIKQIRDEKRISQSDLAKKMGLSQPNIAYLEKRGNNLTIEQCINIATALEVPLKDLLFEEEETIQTVDTKEIEDLKKDVERYKYENEVHKKILKETVDTLLDKMLSEAIYSSIELGINIGQLTTEQLDDVPKFLLGIADVIFLNGNVKETLAKQNIIKIKNDMRTSYYNSPYYKGYKKLSSLLFNKDGNLNFFFDNDLVVNEVIKKLWKTHKNLDSPILNFSILNALKNPKK